MSVTFAATVVEAAKATGGWPEAFEKCGITSANANIAMDAISLYKRQEKDNPNRNVRNKVSYLISIMKMAFQRGGVKTMVSPVMHQEPTVRALTPGETQALCARALYAEWSRFINRNGRQSRLGHELSDKLERKYRQMFPKHLCLDDIKLRCQKFFTETLNAERGRDLSAKELYELLGDLIGKLG